MKIIVTCGPSIEPIDRVRCLTNFSTGELGLLLSNELAARGHDVLCWKGTRATSPLPLVGGKARPFETNDDLLTELRAVAGLEIGAVFHAAALCDFRVGALHGGEQTLAGAVKISSQTRSLDLHLIPAPKVIAHLRPLFPRAKIVGWKYELEGTRADAFARAEEQYRAHGTDACVLNGGAYGAGFAFCRPACPPEHLEDKPALCRFLAAWLGAP